jgi:hypothetical protein
MTLHKNNNTSILLVKKQFKNVFSEYYTKKIKFLSHNKKKFLDKIKIHLKTSILAIDSINSKKIFTFIINL